MADAKKPDPKQPEAPKLSPEEEANARIRTLQEQATQLQRDIRTTQGRVTNRDPKRIAALKQENNALQQRLNILEKALFALVSDSFKARSAEEEALRYEILRQAAVQFCQANNVDPEIWKSIASS